MTEELAQIEPTIVEKAAIKICRFEYLIELITRCHFRAANPDIKGKYFPILRNPCELNRRVWLVKLPLVQSARQAACQLTASGLTPCGLVELLAYTAQAGPVGERQTVAALGARTCINGVDVIPYVSFFSFDLDLDLHPAIIPFDDWACYLCRPPRGQ